MIGRRSFLKLVGVATVIPATLLNNTVTTAPPLFTSKVIKDVVFKATASHKRFESIEIEGEKYYIMMMQPRQSYDLNVLFARDKYKHKQWVKRYNKWRASRGELPYQEVEGEFGVWNV